MAGLEGRVLDRYELRKLAGRGGMADVYRSFDTKFQRDVAVKVFKREDEELLRRFVREARLMASLRNPHLIPVYDTGVDTIDGFPYYYIVMPFMEGGTLRSRIRRNALSLADSCRYLREIADALDYIHAQGIIHRDIKSSNVLLDAKGTAYLSDFGIARNTSDATQLTSTGNVLGTVDYVAPELFEPNYKADARSDYYSLGVLTFEMVTGQLPFSSENQIAVVTMHITRRPPAPSSIVPNIPPSVDRVVLRSLEKQPDLRYTSATAFADAFCQAIQQRRRADAVGRVANAVPQEAAFVPPAPLVLPRSAATDVPPVATRRATRVSNENDTPPAARVTQTFRPQRPSSGQTRGRVVIVIALVALLAVVGPIVYVLLGGSLLGTSKSVGVGTGGQTQTGTKAGTSSTPTATPNLTATDQVVANATQQARNGTATAIVGATVTVQAHASATAGVIQTATTGTPTYQDALNNVDNSQTQQEQWQDDSHCTFTADGYRITKSTSFFNLGQLQGCLESGAKYDNMAFSVDMTIKSGHSGGIFFRVSPKTLGAYAGYLFEVDSKGNYKLSKSSNFSTGTENAILQDWTPSTAIKVGAKNTLQFIASGNTFLLYANGVFLAKVTDDANTFSYGYIALFASTATDGGDATIVYGNMSIYKYS